MDASQSSIVRGNRHDALKHAVLLVETLASYSTQQQQATGKLQQGVVDQYCSTQQQQELSSLPGAVRVSVRLAVSAIDSTLNWANMYQVQQFHNNVPGTKPVQYCASTWYDLVCFKFFTPNNRRRSNFAFLARMRTSHCTSYDDTTISYYQQKYQVKCQLVVVITIWQSTAGGGSNRNLIPVHTVWYCDD